MNVRRFVLPQKLFATLATAIVLLSVLSVSAFADDGKTRVSGKIYEFEKGHYDFSQSETSAITGTDNTYGTFSVQGAFTRESNKSGVPAFTVTDGSLEIFYDYNDAKLTADEDSWHLVDDKSKKVDTLTLDSNIMKGAVILQISTDGNSWNTVTTATDVFQTTPTSKGAVYTCTDMQLENGCFYRFIVAYTLSKREKEGKVLFVNTDKYDTRKYAEVYEFYARSGSATNNSGSAGQVYNLGESKRVKKFSSFSEEEQIEAGDIHSGWKLGNFLVSGFTSYVKDTDGTIVFLKNPGDQVTLSFRLEQNINALNGDEKLTITPAEKANDSYFNTPTMDFGRGALIIRHRDYTNEETEPIYHNYLSSLTTLDADTFVKLCEEGDYEVALDYQVTKDELIDKVGRYRIFCRFAVRNGNCMVYPMDAKTGNELTNGSIAENGFRLDLAKSRYLNITVKRATLNSTGDNFVEDTRFNRAAKDGETYTDEGIYTITVRNNYTHEETIKKIAVGSDPILKAYVTTGMSLSEIQDMVENGAVIQEDGSIVEPTSASIAPSSEVKEPIVDQSSTSFAPESAVSELEQAEQAVEKESNGSPVVAVAGIVILVAVVAVFFLKKKKPDASGSHGGADE